MRKPFELDKIELKAHARNHTAIDVAKDILRSGFDRRGNNHRRKI